MSLHTTAMGPALVEVLERAWKRPFSVKGDFSREMAPWVALAVQEGLITTRLTSNVYGNRWLPTSQGLGVLESLKEQTR